MLTIPPTRPWKRGALAGLVLAVCGPFAVAQERPKRSPADGGEFAVDVAIVHSEIDVAVGSGSGALWFAGSAGRRFSGESSLELTAGDGSRLAVPSVAFELDADEDARGAAETIAAGNALREPLSRALASSDFALLPIRLVQWHRMPDAGKDRIARKQVEAIGQTVEWSDEFLGSTRLYALSHDLKFSRCVRRFKDSGFEIHDHVLTAEHHSQRDSEHYVSHGIAWRAIFHPTWVRSDGKRPEGGLLFLARAIATRTKWGMEFGKGEPLVTADEAAKLAERFTARFVDQLFTAIEDEAIGDPFDSPSTTLLARTRLFDQAAAKRLLNIGGAKSMATTVPMMVASGYAIDGAKYEKLWAAADDPSFRLLYAAGTRLGGKSKPEFVAECKLALAAKDRSVLSAAKVLATALGDPLLASDVEAALARL